MMQLKLSHFSLLQSNCLMTAGVLFQLTERKRNKTLDPLKSAVALI